MRRLKHLVEFAILRWFFIWANALPHRWVMACGAAVGSLGYYVWKRRREIALINLRFCFPEKEDKWFTRVARASFQNFAKSMLDFMRLPKLNARTIDRYHHIENAACFDDALAWGKGGLLFTGHFGSWELTGVGVRLRGYAIHFLVGEQHNKYVDMLMNKLRADAGIGIIHMGVAAKGVFKVLKENGFVAMLSDQDAGPEGAVVTFMGRRASTPKGPAAFVAKTGAAICAGFTVRERDNHNTLYMADALQVPATGDLVADVSRITQTYTDLLTTYVTRYPEQYLWMHRRFKTTYPGLYDNKPAYNA